MPSSASTHSEYKDGYWLTTHDIAYVMTAMLGLTSYYAPVSYDAVASGLEKMVEQYNALTLKGDERAARACARNTRWGRWTTQVTNCEPQGLSGNHWVLTATRFSSNPQAAVWEPLSSKGLSKPVINALKEVCGEHGVQTFVMGQQHDGWSCGYIATWWALHSHPMTCQSALPMEEPPEIPDCWHEVVWLLLQIRDAQSDNQGAMDLEVACHLQLSWDDGYEFGSAIIADLQEQLASLRG